jgi:hypothetical protein
MNRPATQCVWSIHDHEVVAQVASFELATIGTVVEVDH